MAVATWLRLVLTHRLLEEDANERARLVTEDVRLSLQELPSTASRSEFAQVLDSAIRQHRSLVSIELTMQEGQVQSRYVASPGKKPTILHGSAFIPIRTWEPIAVTRRQVQ